MTQNLTTGRFGIPYGTIAEFTLDKMGIYCNEHKIIRGIYVPTGDTEYIIDIDGEVHNAHKWSVLVSKKSIRLNANVREALTSICNSYINIQKQQAVIVAAQRAQYTERQNIRRATDCLEKFSVQSKFGVDLDYCKKLVDTIRDKFHGAYEPYRKHMPSSYDGWVNLAEGDKKGVQITIDVAIFIEKYIDPSKYSFIFREYDGELFVTDQKDVPATFRKTYSQNYVAKFNAALTNAKAIFPHELSELEFRVGDKNMLEATQTLRINIRNQKDLDQFSMFVSKM